MDLKAIGQSWLKEPLAHFMIAGALVFALLSGRAPDAGERRIVVDEALVTRLADRWAMTFRRPPAPHELDGLITDYVREQVYYREALRLGLDQDDEVVIKRMRNKMLALASAEAEAREPGDADLQALLDRNPERYAGEPRYSLVQVYLGNEASSAAALLARLKAGATPEGMGAVAPLPQRYASASRAELAERFGDAFPAALDRLRPGEWSGPIESGLGQHLVRLELREAAPPPRLADVRQRLANDWRAEAIRTAQDADYRRLLEGYEVTIEKPGS